MTLLKVNGVPVRLLIIKIDSFNNKNALNDYKKSLKRLKVIKIANFNIFIKWIKFYIIKANILFLFLLYNINKYKIYFNNI